MSDRIFILTANLPTIRSILNMSREEFGKAVGVTRQHIHAIENGKAHMSFQLYITILAYSFYKCYGPLEDAALENYLKKILGRDMDFWREFEERETK